VLSIEKLKELTGQIKWIPSSGRKGITLDEMTPEQLRLTYTTVKNLEINPLSTIAGQGPFTKTEWLDLLGLRLSTDKKVSTLLQVRVNSVCQRYKDYITGTTENGYGYLPEDLSKAYDFLAESIWVSSKGESRPIKYYTTTGLYGITLCLSTGTVNKAPKKNPHYTCEEWNLIVQLELSKRRRGSVNLTDNQMRSGVKALATRLGYDFGLIEDSSKLNATQVGSAPIELQTKAFNQSQFTVARVQNQSWSWMSMADNGIVFDDDWQKRFLMPYNEAEQLKDFLSQYASADGTSFEVNRTGHTILCDRQSKTWYLNAKVLKSALDKSLKLSFSQDIDDAILFESVEAAEGLAKGIKALTADDWRADEIPVKFDNILQTA
jgi:hypothetical protein